MSIIKIIIIFVMMHINANETNIIRAHVAKMEVNHVYDEKGSLSLDQLILWEYDNSLPSTQEDKVIMWIIMNKIREVYPPQEIEKKQKELEREWFKKYKNLDNCPTYFPPIKKDANLPYYDSKMGKYKITLHITNKLYIITSNEYCETHTQYDKEINNQYMFPIHTRRSLPGYRDDIEAIILK